MKGNKLTAVLFLFLSFSQMALGMVVPDRRFSPRENRYLAQVPAFSLGNILSGRFMAEYEEYVDDQFPGRDAWVFLKTDFLRLLGKRENNGVYFGADDYLLPRYQADLVQLLKNAGEVDAFAKEIGLPVSLLLAPTVSAIYPEKLPPNAPSDDQRAAWLQAISQLGPSVNAVEVISVLKQWKEQDIFFRTDHHWTMRGAYHAYAAWMESKGTTPLPLSEFHSEVVSDNFWGSHYSRANSRRVPPDQIALLRREHEPRVTVNYPGESLSVDSLYRPEFLSGRDQYAYFLGGNYPLVQIETDTQNGRSILLIKDSYAHNFVPFLAAHYQEIHLIDLRYYALSTREYIKEHAIDEVLFLFSLQQFGQNTGLAKLGS